MYKVTNHVPSVLLSYQTRVRSSINPVCCFCCFREVNMAVIFFDRGREPLFPLIVLILGSDFDMNSPDARE